MEQCGEIIENFKKEKQTIAVSEPYLDKNVSLFLKLKSLESVSQFSSNLIVGLKLT